MKIERERTIEEQVPTGQPDTEAPAEEPIDPVTQGKINRIKEILVADYPDGRYIPHFDRIEAYAKARIAMESGDSSQMAAFNDGLTDDEFAQIQPAIVLAREIMIQTSHGRHLERRKR